MMKALEIQVWTNVRIAWNFPRFEIVYLHLPSEASCFGVNHLLLLIALINTQIAQGTISVENKTKQVSLIYSHFRSTIYISVHGSCLHSNTITCTHLKNYIFFNVRILTSFSMEHIIKWAKSHVLANDDEIRRLVACPKNRQNIWMIEDSAKSNKTKGLH